MLTRKNFLAGSAALIASSVLAACGNSGSASSSASETKTLTVAASPSPHAEILNNFAVPKLKDQNIDLEVKEYTDYIIPNQVTSSGEVDANYFQHINYLNNYNKENGTDLVGVAAIHYEPFGIYAGKSSDLKNIADGAQIAVPNDPTNEGRAFLLLQQEGLVTLKDPENLEATPVDVAENPHSLNFVEVEAAAVPRQLQDVDFAVINGNYAIEAGLHVSDAVAVEAADGTAVEQYANYIVTTPDKQDDDRIKALVSVLTSDDFKTYLKDTYDEDVLPAF
ncbi:MAG: MetQ/NlpA family ABC transporter substrate-binding protein [Coriobacteriaceae bacterium]|jgi:D-methionine transport system substrate-binding protein|uniref:MetQ/NlpA family ABC transporter substrate-binding protein n=1 Tax=Olsenella TaxID=133925 RepID=UPI000FF7C193|nr:MetQ/NlpA family ABC transporter substrate-binding protein [Atopobiaceae bacterium]MDD6706059.1 MetQ/NlpA family ABC transporter substrate-binding protein [Olsenella sp.]RRF94574.1 MAG: MetQ/NlpA family ABC transporter substrate-binding protein [Coriobacteriaceae bacterium]MCI1344189.1 MetQ/NlpA family ABC transporter substrate-binding protein [Atopobiaceae bacterium]MCI1498120.1 MetQ/NlpA family ABC transporter substrate-binding protein [Atopobiaceae bacterium]